MVFEFISVEVHSVFKFFWIKVLTYVSLEISVLSGHL